MQSKVPSDETWGATATLFPAARSNEITGLATGDTRQARVRAVNAQGIGPWVDASGSTWTVPGPVSMKVGGLRAGSYSPGNPRPATEAPPLPNYLMQVSSTGDSNYGGSITYSPTAKLDHAITGLLPGATRWVRVLAANRVGNGPCHGQGQVVPR